MRYNPMFPPFDSEGNPIENPIPWSPQPINDGVRPTFMPSGVGGPIFNPRPRGEPVSEPKPSPIDIFTDRLKNKRTLRREKREANRLDRQQRRAGRQEARQQRQDERRANRQLRRDERHLRRGRRKGMLLGDEPILTRGEPVSEPKPRFGYGNSTPDIFPSFSNPNPYFGGIK